MAPAAPPTHSSRWLHLRPRVAPRRRSCTPGRWLASRRCQDAVAELERFAQSASPVMAAHAHAAAADCLVRLGRGAEAVSLLEQAASTPDLPRLQAIEFREQLVVARLRAGDDAACTRRARRTAVDRTLGQLSRRAELRARLARIRPRTLPHRRPNRPPRPRRAGRTGRARRPARSVRQLIRGGRDSLRAGPLPRGAWPPTRRFWRPIRRTRERLRRSTAAACRWFDLPRTALGSRCSRASLNAFPNTESAADGMFRGGRIRESLGDLDGASQSYRTLVGAARRGFPRDRCRVPARLRAVQTG